MNNVVLPKKQCKICSKLITGRQDKMFCSIRCKNYYHVNLRRVTNAEAIDIDRILHRNRSILLELMGRHKTQIKLDRIYLERKKFRFKYLTHFHINKRGKILHWVYDFAWMQFSDDDILIVRKRD